MHGPDCTAWPDAALAQCVMRAEPQARSAEAELCRRFARRARLYGLRHLRDPHAADDLAQRVMLLTIEKLRGGALRDPGSIGSFVFGIARTLVHGTRRSRRDHVPLSVEGAELPFEGPVDSDPLARAQLVRCLEALAERERTIVVLTYYREAPTTDIARSLGIAEGNVRVVRHRAMKSLRACMEPSGPDAREQRAS